MVQMLFLCMNIAAATANTFAPNDSNIYYSPYAWHVTDTYAATINSAAYVRFMFSGTELNFNFNTSLMASPTSEVYWRVDNGPRTTSLVLDSISISIPPNNTKGDIKYHTVELFVKSTTERAERWSNTGITTRIILTSIETDGQLAKWIPSETNILVYGDSITEGVLTLGGSQKFDTDHNDASVVYSYILGGLLGAEVGVVAFGASGLTHDGSGHVPPLQQSWNQLWDGVPRVFEPRPDLIIFNEGTNDGCDTTTPGCVGTDITANMTDVLNNLLMACPGTPIAVLELFNLGQSGHLRAAVNATKSDDVHYISTAGVYDLQYGGSLHPTGPNDVGRIAPQIANKVRPLLAQSILKREGLL